MLLEIAQNSQERIHKGIFFQPATCNFIEKRRRYIYFSVNFAKIFREKYSWTKEQNLLGTGFKRGILRKMANRHSYCKEISQSRQLFQRTEIVREKVYLITIDRKLTLNLKEIVNSFTDISFLKYFTEIFFYLSLFLGKNLGVFYGTALSGCACIFYQVKELISCKYFIRTLGNIQRTFLHLILFYWSWGSEVLSQKIIFLEICESFRITSKELVLENHIL